MDDADELYGLPLDRFTAERNGLATRLAKEGDKDAAAEVRALRKPTVAAWAVNQLARRHPRDVDLLLDAGHRLIEAQRSGNAGEAAARHRAVVDDLVGAARALLGAKPSEAAVRQVTETLRASSLTQEGRELLARGRLTEALATTGWEILAANPPAGGSRSRTARGGGKTGTSRRDVEKARRELREAEQALKQARRDERDAEQEHARAETALEQARRETRERERRRDAAEEALERAKRPG